MIKAKVSLDWDAISKAIEDGKIKFEPPVLTSHFREEMMRAWEGTPHTMRDAGRLRYARGSQSSLALPDHPNMPMAYPITTRMYMDYKAKTRKSLGEDFERLTAHPVILDDHCMLLLEQFIEVTEAIKRNAVAGIRITPDDSLRIRRDQIRDEFALTSALILRYPEIQHSHEARVHIRLSWQQLAFLALMPLNNTNFRDVAANLYTDSVIENFDLLVI